MNRWSAASRYRIAALVAWALMAATGPAVAGCSGDLERAANDLACARYPETIEAVGRCLATEPSTQDEILARTLLVEAYLASNDPSGSASAIDSWNTTIEDAVSRCVQQAEPEVSLFYGDLAIEAARALEFSTCFVSPQVAGKDCPHELSEAARHYADGQFDQVALALRPCLTTATRPRYKGAAYALLAMTYLAVDDVARAESAVARLVRVDPGYDPERDPGLVPAGPALREEFIRAVERAKSQGDRSVEEVLGIDACLERLDLCPTSERVCQPGPPAERWDVGIQAGFFVPDNDLSSKSEGFDQIEPLIGITVGRMLSDRWGLFADATWFDINTDFNDPEREDANTITIGLEAKRLFRHRSWKISSADPAQTRSVDWRWLVSFGAGWSHYDLQNSRSAQKRTLASFGFGQRWRLDRRARLRWELGFEQTLDNEGFRGRKLTTFQLLLNVTWALRLADGVR